MNVQQLKINRKIKLAAIKKEEEDSKPELTDLNNISKLYECFKRASKGLPKRTERQYYEIFIYIILSLYFPLFIVGDRIPTPLRRELLKVLKIKRVQKISDIISEITVKSEHFKDFRSDIEYFSAVMFFDISRRKMK